MCTPTSKQATRAPRSDAPSKPRPHQVCATLQVNVVTSTRGLIKKSKGAAADARASRRSRTHAAATGATGKPHVSDTWNDFSREFACKCVRGACSHRDASDHRACKGRLGSRFFFGGLMLGFASRSVAMVWAEPHTSLCQDCVCAQCCPKHPSRLLCPWQQAPTGVITTSITMFVVLDAFVGEAASRRLVTLGSVVEDSSMRVSLLESIKAFEARE